MSENWNLSVSFLPHKGAERAGQVGGGEGTAKRTRGWTACCALS